MHPFTKLSIAKHVPKYYQYYFTIILLENYQLISVSKNACSTLYVILMYYSFSSLGFELMLPQSTGDFTGAFTN